MTEQPGEKSAADRVLDVAIYAPLGLALSALEAVPQLARKGRDRLRPQVGLARTVGQLAVREGYRQFVGFANSNGPISLGPLSFGGSRSNLPDASRGRGESTTNGNRTASIPRLEPVRVRAEVVEDGLSPDALSVGELAIPSYDSLSAPQVLQRLDGLSPDEVAAVRAYEAATRRRRTIITRADQILD
jgi:hypothetical protein